MSPARGSLRLRLFLAGAAAVAVALAIAALVLSLMFERHAQRVMVSDLDARALALVATIDGQDLGIADVRQNRLDPQYDLPFSGKYWQLTIGDRMIQSRSLWDFTLSPQDPPPAVGALRVELMDGPQGAQLVGVDRSLLIGRGADAVPLRIVVAQERAGLISARRDFLDELLPYLALLAALLMAASWVQIGIGLRPLDSVGARIAALARGERARMGQDLPREVGPLAAQIDYLLDAREQELDRARRRAADLAHGFKTPLQGLMGDAQLLRNGGDTDTADSIEALVAAMRGIVDRELTRARIQSDHLRSATDVAQLIERMLKLMRRLPRGADLDWRLIAPPPHPFARIDRQDLTEALGALLENAMRHAAFAVTIRVEVRDGKVVIAIRDDGPGVPPDRLDQLVRRGVSLDQTGQGHGFGLSIAQDILAAAGGELRLANADPGLEATLILHKAATPQSPDASPSVPDRAAPSRPRHSAG